MANDGDDERSDGRELVSPPVVREFHLDQPLDTEMEKALIIAAAAVGYQVFVTEVSDGPLSFQATDLADLGLPEPTRIDHDLHLLFIEGPEITFIRIPESWYKTSRREDWIYEDMKSTLEVHKSGAENLEESKLLEYRVQFGSPTEIQARQEAQCRAENAALEGVAAHHRQPNSESTEAPGSPKSPFLEEPPAEAASIHGSATGHADSGGGHAQDNKATQPDTASAPHEGQTASNEDNKSTSTAEPNAVSHGQNKWFLGLGLPMPLPFDKAPTGTLAGPEMSRLVEEHPELQPHVKLFARIEVAQAEAEVAFRKRELTESWTSWSGVHPWDDKPDLETTDCPWWVAGAGFVFRVAAKWRDHFPAKPDRVRALLPAQLKMVAETVYQSRIFFYDVVTSKHLKRSDLAPESHITRFSDFSLLFAMQRFAERDLDAWEQRLEQTKEAAASLPGVARNKSAPVAASQRENVGDTIPKERAISRDSPPYPKRSDWFQKQLELRDWSVHKFQAHDGPDWKTSRKILDGLSVSRAVLEKCAAALSKKKGNVLFRDIPGD